MLFEIRNTVPDVTASWIPARDSFLAGRTREAWDLAVALRPAKLIASANDFVLNMEIARGCASHPLYAALERLAFRRFPQDPVMQLYHARMLLTRGQFQRGIAYLMSLEATLGKTQRGLWASSLANMYGSTGFEKSCRNYLAIVSCLPEAQHPLALYQQSCASEGIRHWDEAIRFGQLCAANAPNWSRMRSHLASCLLARGRIDEARNELEEVTRRGLEEATCEFSKAMLAMSLGDFAASRLELERLLVRWPQADFAKWVRRTLCILLFEMGDFAAASETAQGKEKELGLPSLPKTASGKRRFIPLPLLMQNKNQCVPASVAMAAFAQGRSFDPETLYREMEGRDGTMMSKMRKWTGSQGLMAAPIRLEKEAIVAMLDQGVAMVGVLEGLFSSHVDVICGYNDDLETLYVRDPVSWAPVAWPWQMGLSRYTLNGGVFAIFDASRADLVSLAETWRAGPFEALVDLEEAVEAGELAAAEAAYARIPDDSPVAFLRDLNALHVAISPKTFQARLQQYASDENADRLVRIRALLSLGPDDSNDAVIKLLESEEGKGYGSAILQFLKLNRLMSQGSWTEANELIDHLIDRGGAVARVWEMKSDVLAELGDHEGSAAALEKAIELEPMRVPFRQKQLDRSAKKITQADLLRQIDELLTSCPGYRPLIWARADALRDSHDGKEYERSAQLAMRYYPREPKIYLNLLNWYQHQGRPDLEQSLLKVAQQRMPETFGSAEPAAEEKSEAKVEPVAETNSSPQEAIEALPAPLPTDKAELMSLIWNESDPRRAAAVARLMEMEREGTLHWYESARLLGCRLLMLQPEDSVSPQSLLPANPPGAAPWFAGCLYDSLSGNNISIAVAQATAEWLKRLVDLKRFPELWFNYVLLLEWAMRVEEALVELQKIVTQYPGYGSALYRLGVVKRRQGDLKSAKSYFERALNADLGLYGAQKLLVEVHDQLGNAADALHYTRMLRKKMPYSMQYLSEEAHRIRNAESLAAALKTLDEQAADFPPTSIATLRARLYFHAENLSQAEKILRNIPFDAKTADDELFEDYVKLKLEIARKRENQAEVLACCDLGLGRWPDSNLLLELKAECVAKTAPQQSRDLLRRVLLKGDPRAKTVATFRSVLNGEWENAASELIASAEPQRREDLAALVADAFQMPQEAAAKRNFLRTTLEKLPHSLEIRWRLASDYFNAKLHTEAVQEAREALRREPDHPGVHALLGRFLFESDAKEALTHLETACRFDRTPWNMFDLARCRQMVGDYQGSRQLHWEILELDPSRMSSWTNLYLLSTTHFSQDVYQLWTLLAPALKAGYGLEDEYYMVAAVKIANQLEKVLPPQWIGLAVERYKALRTIEGFGDEKQLLTLSLLAWKMRRPHEIPATCVVPTSWSKWYQARFKWPRLAWIPKR